MTTTKEKIMYKHLEGSFEKLTEDNYTKWAKFCKLLLETQLLWTIVEGSEEEPVGNTLAIINRQKELKFRCAKALQIILSSITKACQNYVKDLTNPKRMWDKLAREFNVISTRPGRRSLRPHFDKMRPNDGNNILNWIAELKSIYNKLSGTDEAVNELQLVRKLLNCMPPAYNTTIEYLKMNEDAHTSVTIVKALKRKEAKLLKEESDSYTGDAHVTTAGKQISSATRLMAEERRKNGFKFCVRFRQPHITRKNVADLTKIMIPQNWNLEWENTPLGETPTIDPNLAATLLTQTTGRSETTETAP